ncbi:hypothetical protein FKM82_024081 [Ascaphus truei]
MGRKEEGGRVSGEARLLEVRGTPEWGTLCGRRLLLRWKRGFASWRMLVTSWHWGMLWGVVLQLMVCVYKNKKIRLILSYISDSL